MDLGEGPVVKGIDFRIISCLPVKAVPEGLRPFAFHPYQGEAKLMRLECAELRRQGPGPAGVQAGSSDRIRYPFPPPCSLPSSFTPSHVTLKGAR